MSLEEHDHNKKKLANSVEGEKIRKIYIYLAQSVLNYTSILSASPLLTIKPPIQHTHTKAPARDGKCANIIQ